MDVVSKPTSVESNPLVFLTTNVGVKVPCDRFFDPVACAAQEHCQLLNDITCLDKDAKPYCELFFVQEDCLSSNLGCVFTGGVCHLKHHRLENCKDALHDSEVRARYL